MAAARDPAPRGRPDADLPELPAGRFSGGCRGAGGREVGASAGQDRSLRSGRGDGLAAGGRGGARLARLSARHRGVRRPRRPQGRGHARAALRLCECARHPLPPELRGRRAALLRDRARRLAARSAVAKGLRAAGEIRPVVRPADLLAADARCAGSGADLPGYADHPQPHWHAAEARPRLCRVLAERHAHPCRSAQCGHQNLGSGHVPPRLDGRPDPPLRARCDRDFWHRTLQFASNFPVDKLHADYHAIWQAFDGITAGFSPEERRALFHDNAARFYRL